MLIQSDLNRQSLSTQIAGHLVDILEKGDYAPGDSFLGEQEVAERYGVSRPVVREAYQTLAAKGYIAIQKGRRAKVLPPGIGLLNDFFSRVLSKDIESWKQLMDVRENLELLSARSAARNRNPADIVQLRSIVHAMELTINRPEDYAVQDINFHIALASASGNPYLRYLIESVRRNLVGVLTELRAALPKGIVSHVQASHVRITDAVESRDPEAAAEAMRVHFEIVRDNLERVRE